METLLNQEQTLKLYDKATPKERKLLEKLHEKDFFNQPKPLVTDWKEFCKINKVHPVNSLPYPKAANAKQHAINAFHIIDEFRQQYNKDPKTGKLWIPDYNNSNQYKWYPWFKGQPGAGFRFYDTGCAYSFTLVGSRLVFKDEYTASYAGENLIKYYEQLFTL